jgi:PEP-CTERM motif
MTRWTFRTTAALALVAALAGSATARAGLLPVNVSIQPENGNQRYTYGVILTTDAFIKAGDYFTVYDFAGFIPGSNVQPDGWTFSTSKVGKTPVNTNPTDDPTIPNLTWVYTGQGQINGQIGLGNFSAVSPFQNTDFNSFTARSNRLVDGRIDTNITDTQVPVPGTTLHAPEPATLALMGLGLPLLLLRRLRRKA